MLEKNRENEVHVEKVEQRPTDSIAFGLERIGLIAVKAPILSCIILLALIVGAVFGIYRIKIDDSLSQLFRSNTPGIPAIRRGDQEVSRPRNSTSWSWSKARSCWRATTSRSCATSSPTCNWSTARAA